MCKRVNDIIGKRFGELTVQNYSHKDTASRNYFLCTCSCGKVKTIQQSNLLSGRSSTCGCGRKSIREPHVSESIQTLAKEPDVPEELDIASLKVIPCGLGSKRLAEDIIMRLKATNPFVLRETTCIHKGDRVVLKKGHLLGNADSYGSVREFEITLDGGSVVRVDSVYDVWLLGRYNDAQKGFLDGR